MRITSFSGRKVGKSSWVEPAASHCFPDLALFYSSGRGCQPLGIAGKQPLFVFSWTYCRIPVIFCRIEGKKCFLKKVFFSARLLWLAGFALPVSTRSVAGARVVQPPCRQRGLPGANRQCLLTIQVILQATSSAHRPMSFIHSIHWQKVVSLVSLSALRRYLCNSSSSSFFSQGLPIR